jgi:hypothetical protein
MRSITGDEITKMVEDTLYTAVGLGVLGFQRMQVHRQELKRSLAGFAREARRNATELVDRAASGA